MLNPRLLVVLCALPDGETALCTVLEALAHAGRPYRLRFALPDRFEPAFAEAAASGSALCAGDVKFYDEAAGLGGVAGLVTDETHFLSLRGEYAFRDGWEGVLLSRFGLCREPRALMTAVTEGEGDAAQAYLPAFREPIDGEGAALGAGLPLVASAAPVKTLAVHPGFVFGTIGFLRDVTTDFDTLSIAAYAAGYAVYALDRAPLYPASRCAPARLGRPSPELLPSPSLTRFEQLAGVSFDAGTASTRARMGLFGLANSYAQRLPPALALRQRLRAALCRAAPPPLTVTAFVDLPGAAHPAQSYLQRFFFLKALGGLPLVLYTGGETERVLRANFPHTLAYPDNALLPRTLLGEGMTPAQLFERNKFLLLQRAASASPSYRHLAWLDIDALPHPVCPDAVPDFSALTDDRVHIGWVGNDPDLGLIVAPRELAGPLAAALKAVTQLDTAMKRRYDRRPLIRRLMRRHPDMFTIHLLPRRGLLFLTCFPPELISAPLRALLSDLPAPVRVVPTAPEKKERVPHDRPLPESPID